jgi:hypothetical protein
MRALTAAAAPALAAYAFAAAVPISSARGAYSCAPPHLGRSALLAGSVTVSPQPASRDAQPRTQISFLGVPAPRLRVLSVTGSRTGAHRGGLLAYSQGDGASFVPAQPFAEGERVTVRARVRLGSRSVQMHDVFTIARHDSIFNPPEAAEPVGTKGVQGFLSRPDLHPPAVAVTARSASVAPGDEFLAPYSGPGQVGPMILDPAGGLIWFKPLPANVSATNFRVQEYLGAPVLTWWQGEDSVHGFGLGEGVIANSSYTEIAHVAAGNGLQADLHEFELTPRGTALITAYDTQLCDLSGVGGSAKGAATDGVLQEIDVRTGLVRFQWTSLGHVALADSYELARKSSREWPFDFFHINSIDPEPDGHLLVSARNTWTTYDIDPRGGQIVWRLGGKHTSFTLARGAATAWQHDARLLPDGDISIFDNGASPRVHHESRGVVVGLDAQHKTARLLSQLTRPVPIVAESQGNFQALPNGDWFVGWGQVSDISEFNAGGELLFDAHLPGHVESYRAFRFSWEGTPSEPPELAIRSEANGATVVYASWNGATRVASWAVYAGSSTASLPFVAEAPRSGFETAIALPPGTQGPYVTVQALDAGGNVLGTAPAKPLP